MGASASKRNGKHLPSRARQGASAKRIAAVSNPLVFTIASDFAAGRDVQNQILEDIRKNGFEGNTFFAINLALEEAIANAIRHGNRLDPTKKVHVEARISPNRAEIMIEDEGAGFDRQSIPDPTAVENLEKCSGRGILLMEAYMSKVSWDRGGRRVRMIKENETSK